MQVNDSVKWKKECDETRPVQTGPGLARRVKEDVRVIAITSGKGGVGKTNISANLAYSLSHAGKRVLVLDADMGLANMDVILGLTPKYNINHVLLGEKSLSGSNRPRARKCEDPSVRFGHRRPCGAFEGPEAFPVQRTQRSERGVRFHADRHGRRDLGQRHVLQYGCQGDYCCRVPRADFAH